MIPCALAETERYSPHASDAPRHRNARRLVEAHGRGVFGSDAARAMDERAARRGVTWRLHRLAQDGGSTCGGPVSPERNEAWSGRRDLNPRRRAPKARALPDCATPRGCRPGSSTLSGTGPSVTLASSSPHSTDSPADASRSGRTPSLATRARGSSGRATTLEAEPPRRRGPGSDPRCVTGATARRRLETASPGSSSRKSGDPCRRDSPGESCAGRRALAIRGRDLRGSATIRRGYWSEGRRAARVCRCVAPNEMVAGSRSRLRVGRREPTNLGAGQIEQVGQLLEDDPARDGLGEPLGPRGPSARAHPPFVSRRGRVRQK